MLDLNHILLFIAFVSPAVVLARTWPRAALNRAWRLAAFIVLVVTVLAYFFAPTCAGFLGGGAWLLLLFFPAVGLRKAADFVSAGRYTTAQLILSPLRFLHPVPAVREQYLLTRGLALAQRGARDEAFNVFTRLAQIASSTGRQAFVQTLRLRGDWKAVAEWCYGAIPRFGLGEDPSLFLSYLRALGELGNRDELVMQFAGRASALLASPAQEPVFLFSRMLVLAFCGRTEALRELFGTALRRIAPDVKEFWIATSEFAAGEVGASRARLERLQRTTSDGLVRGDAELRLRRRGELPPLALSPANEATVRRFERIPERGRGSLFAPPSSGATPAVAVLIALNVAMFVAEIARGGSTNRDTLHSLGALEPFAVFVQGQYWRMISALFLHYGAIHLLFNAYALYVLGPSLERSIGTLRFTVCYLVAGIGSSAGVVLLWRLGLTQADFLVGASGSVMGIVGAWAGTLLRHRHMPMARRRLINIGLIVAMQTAFDLYTPQVSMAAHLCGLATGLVVGILISPQESDVVA